MFTEQMKEVLNENYNQSITENGAIGYKTQGSKLVDLNFMASSMRKMSENEIMSHFMDAWYEKPMLAMKWLFYLRDCREGLGERNSFRVIMQNIAEQNQEVARAVLNLIPTYGRWDDLVYLVSCNNASITDEICDILYMQLQTDIQEYFKQKPISLLAKWLPSENTSSQKTKELAKIIRQHFGWSAKKYRQTLSMLRKYLDVTECKMSAKEWNEIDYSKVPSVANLKYNNAFLRNDTERRKEYLNQLQNGETKINASVLFPHDIVHKYCKNMRWWRDGITDTDLTLEELWKNLKSVEGIENTIVVADGSGSMSVGVDNKSNVSAIEVANGLAIYCSQYCKGEFKDKYITFSQNPQLVDFANAKTLKEKINIAFKYDEVANTNIEAVFDLILQTAINNNLTQDEIPNNILILSDMEFDEATSKSIFDNTGFDQSLFKIIAKKYAKYDYKLPRLIFWNLNSRTKTIPITQNENGLVLVSGFSTNVLSMVMNNETDPYKNLVKELNKDRYMPIEECLFDILN